MSREIEINRIVQNYDRELVAQRDFKGTMCVWRKANKFEAFEFEGIKYLYARPHLNLVFALTDNWTQKGRPVEWGLEPILNRLKSIDVWRDPDFAENLIAQYEKDAQSQKRQMKNTVESFLIDYRRQFAKTFGDVNTSTLEKTDKRRIKDGRYKSR
jgi:hypothetical protein